ncbi:MAG: hypothetical protein ABI413_07965 [Ktedonobacteraceae bacterium]
MPRSAYSWRMLPHDLPRWFTAIGILTAEDLGTGHGSSPSFMICV